MMVVVEGMLQKAARRATRMPSLILVTPQYGSDLRDCVSESKLPR